MVKGIARDQVVSVDSIDLSRALRKSATTAENKLWSVLRGKKMNGRKFRRQQPIDGFIADFFCPALGLVIEVDGRIHLQHQARDRARDAHFREKGLRVVRFSNEEVISGFNEVVETLLRLTRE